MAHVVFVDAFDATFRTMMWALDAGHRVTFVRPQDVRWFSKSSLTIQVTERVQVRPIETASDASSVQDVLAAILEEGKVDAVIHQVDATIESTAKACSDLGIRFTSVAGVQNARNKHTTRQLIGQAKMASVQQRVAYDVDSILRHAAIIGYPIIVKPVSGFGSMLSRKIDDAIDLREFATAAFRGLARLPDGMKGLAARGLLAEEYLAGDIVSVEIFASPHGWRCIGVNGLALAELNECIGLGTIVPAPLTTDEELACCNYAKAACQALGLDFGIFHVELILTFRGPVLLEVNPRMMGGVMTYAYLLATGQSFDHFVLAAYLGEPLPAHPRPWRTIVTRKLLANGEAIIPDDVPIRPSYFHPALKEFFNYNIVSGRHVSSEDMLARCLVAGDTYEDAALSAEEIRLRFQDVLGFPLQKPLPIGRRKMRATK